MGTNHNSTVALARNRRYEARLSPWMRKIFNLDTILSCAGIRDDLLYLFVQPGCGLDAIVGFVVSSVERRKVRKVVLQLLCGQLLC